MARDGRAGAAEPDRARNFSDPRQPSAASIRETGVLAETGVADADDITVVTLPPDDTTHGFAAGYDGMFRASYRVAYRLLGRREEAGDIAQEACARAFARWRKVQRLDSPEAWVSRVAANLAIDSWRRSATAAGHPRPRDVDLVAAEHGTDGRIDLHRALMALPRRQREVVTLRFVADMTEQQVAEALGCAVGTVKSHAARGLTALRSTLTLEDV